MAAKENRPAEGGRAAETFGGVTGKDSALRLHARGLHVFPVDHPRQPDCIGKHGPGNPCDGIRGKHPAVTWGTWSVAPTAQMIEQQWVKHHGRANIGIACGPSNLVVFDEDAPGEVTRWCSDHGVTLPDTYEVSTGRGRHLYYGWDHTAQRIGNVPKAVQDYKIDIRGDGGFVVAEGSRHESGHLYIGNGAEVADLPVEVAEVLLAAATGETDHAATPAEREGFDPDAEIPYGARDTELTRYAGRLRKSGLDFAEVEPAFRDRWLCCQQPVGQIPEARFHSADCPDAFTWEQALAKLRNAFGRYPAGRDLAENSEGLSGPQGHEHAVLARVADVEPERVSWLWEARLPVGKLVTLDGDPGLGKSTLALTIAAAVTGAMPWPDGSQCTTPGAVLLMSAEDGLADTIRPRLDAAGADVTKVYAVQGIPIDSGGTLRPPTLADVAALEAAITETGARLLIIDVLMAYLPGSTDSHRDQDVRAVLSRLAALADRTGVAVLLLRHLTKGGGRDPIYRGGGSIGIVGAARAGLLVACDPDDHDRRVLASVKSNLGPAPASLAFRLVGVSEHGCARVVWDGVSDHDAGSLLAEFGEHDDEPGGNPAKVFISEYLLGQGGQCATSDVLKAGRAAGFSEKELKDARYRARKPRILSRKDGFGGGWVWAIDNGAPEGRTQGREGSRTPDPATLATFVRPSQGAADGADDPATGTVAPVLSLLAKRRSDGELSDEFEPPHGEGRCADCGFHVETQGHRPGCQQTIN